MITLECTGLTKKYGSVPAVDNLNLQLESGRVVGLLGPNGSGKTTLIKMANGLIAPNSGEIKVCGFVPGTESKALVSYLPDVDYLPNWMTIDRLVDYFSDFYSDFDANKASDMLKRLNIGEKSTMKQLSKGTREKVQLVLVMSRKAKLYLLDEPIGGVDPATRDYILNTIVKNYSEDATVLISTHLISEVENILDEVLFINRGKIVLRSPADEIREKEGKSVDALFREVFKCSESL